MNQEVLGWRRGLFPRLLRELMVGEAVDFRRLRFG